MKPEYTDQYPELEWTIGYSRQWETCRLEELFSVDKIVENWTIDDKKKQKEIFSKLKFEIDLESRAQVLAQKSLESIKKGSLALCQDFTFQLLEDWGECSQIEIDVITWYVTPKTEKQKKEFLSKQKQAAAKKAKEEEAAKKFAIEKEEEERALYQKLKKKYGNGD